MVLEQLTGWEGIIFVFLLVIFLITGGVVTFIILNRRFWNFKYIVLENISGQGFVPSKKGRCRLVGFGDGGEEIFSLKKPRRYRAAYGKRIGKNYICWTIGEDGYWYNSTFGDFNKKLFEMGVTPTDRDMRYSYASLRKGIENRYNEKTFIEKWGVPISIGLLIIAIAANGVSYYYGFSKINEGLKINADVAKTNKDILGTLNGLLEKASIIKGGSGLTPV